MTWGGGLTGLAPGYDGAAPLGLKTRNTKANETLLPTGEYAGGKAYAFAADNSDSDPRRIRPTAR